VSWIPLFPLDLALLPDCELPLHIFEPRYRKMIARCLRESLRFGIARIHDGALASIGTEASVKKVLRRYPDGRFDILTEGGERVRIQETREHRDGYIEADTEPVAEAGEESDHALEDHVSEQYRRYASLVSDIPEDPPPRGPQWSFRLADRMRLEVAERQELLEIFSENARLMRLKEHLSERIPMVIEREKAKRVVRGNGRLRHGRPPAGLADSKGGAE
jgi:ATP-dependent Lon protease